MQHLQDWQVSYLKINIVWEKNDWHNFILELYLYLCIWQTFVIVFIPLSIDIKFLDCSCMDFSFKFYVNFVGAWSNLLRSLSEFDHVTNQLHTFPVSYALKLLYISLIFIDIHTKFEETVKKYKGFCPFSSVLSVRFVNTYCACN